MRSGLFFAPDDRLDRPIASREHIDAVADQRRTWRKLRAMPALPESRQWPRVMSSRPVLYLTLLPILVDAAAQWPDARFASFGKFDRGGNPSIARVLPWRSRQTSPLAVSRSLR